MAQTPVVSEDNQLTEALAEIERLRGICAEAYQLAGAYSAPIKALDNLCAAAQGEKIPHEFFLPVVNQWEGLVYQMRAALEWYANPRTWNQWLPDSAGEHARKALVSLTSSTG